MAATEADPDTAKIQIIKSTDAKTNRASKIKSVDHGHGEYGFKALLMAMEEATTYTGYILPASETMDLCIHGVAGPVDIKTPGGGFYIPKQIAGKFNYILNHFVEHQVLVEMTVGLTLVAAEPPAQLVVALVHPVYRSPNFHKSATDIIEIWN
ncbi:hypothetical protein BGZ93_007265 [Podila epicladia]|nr:hypothetical protein BGZ93_007265 [Podila epicladia]